MPGIRESKTRLQALLLRMSWLMTNGRGIETIKLDNGFELRLHDQSRIMAGVSKGFSKDIQITIQRVRWCQLPVSG